jgi:hypothetical protein
VICSCPSCTSYEPLAASRPPTPTLSGRATPRPRSNFWCGSWCSRGFRAVPLSWQNKSSNLVMPAAPSARRLPHRPRVLLRPSLLGVHRRPLRRDGGCELAPCAPRHGRRPHGFYLHRPLLLEPLETPKWRRLQRRAPVPSPPCGSLC